MRIVESCRLFYLFYTVFFLCSSSLVILQFVPGESNNDPELRKIFHYSFKKHYSLLKLFTGFAIAAFIAWKLTVISAITSAEIPAIANTLQLIETLYSKF